MLEVLLVFVVMGIPLGALLGLVTRLAAPPDRRLFWSSLFLSLALAYFLAALYDLLSGRGALDRPGPLLLFAVTAVSSAGLNLIYWVGKSRRSQPDALEALGVRR